MAWSSKNNAGKAAINHIYCVGCVDIFHLLQPNRADFIGWVGGSAVVIPVATAAQEVCLGGARVGTLTGTGSSSPTRAEAGAAAGAATRTANCRTSIKPRPTMPTNAGQATRTEHIKLVSSEYSLLPPLQPALSLIRKQRRTESTATRRRGDGMADTEPPHPIKDTAPGTASSSPPP
ncbi:hypothetical protein IV203_021189 [Nitzschia inconspicua]|uniref:Uncharacterized protein n=1 Tax=Nitzschia inconspicua TaxID=303405 RepID=A0A9K3PFR8_9STRA|nr:hypothetical protein IV203_021189 [Nitzschia inconspicua]